eukprot:15625209-Heterocapsa_arctica.AAC.1
MRASHRWKFRGARTYMRISGARARAGVTDTSADVLRIAADRHTPPHTNRHHRPPRTPKPCFGYLGDDMGHWSPSAQLSIV